MSPLHKAEQLLRLRDDNWWQDLCELIPELTPLESTPQPSEYHQEGNVAIHTQLAIERCPKSCDPDLLWVALLHDIGKPSTTKQQTNGRLTAHGHAKVGSEIAGQILFRVGMPTRRRDRITWVIRHHGFHHAWQLRQADELSKRQRNYLMHEDFPLLLELLRVDSLASHGNPDGMQTYVFYKALWESLDA
ncbi:MAG: HD domain-containing protein [Deltaproteobacteria bacterium]|jgi:putative nucleotidyltransferase with HDIG domain|nr:HD domain-containing protein [Deltaproteobacteria bacterium]